MSRKQLIIVCLLIAGLLNAPPMLAQRGKFSAAEQQQISVPTPGLFDDGDAFVVDFKAIADRDYSFPLPVGNATLIGNQSLEITTVRGDAVKAMFDGVVRLSRKHPQYGNVIVIRHDNGLETVYANNAQNMVKVGQHIQAGQTVAIVGGSADRVYCTFAAMVNGGWINPATIVDPVSHRLRKQAFQFKKNGGRVDLSVAKAERSEAVSLDPDDAVDNPFANDKTFRLNLEAISKDRWAYPLAGSHVISPYGGKRNHLGVDVKTKPKDKIVAAFDGVVTRSGPFSGYGNCIVIRHAYGFETLYSHQFKNLVRVGQKVKAGEVIGLTGRTGRATTEHLHFEVKFRGRCLNPVVLFNHVSKTLQCATLLLTKSGGVTSKKN